MPIRWHLLAAAARTGAGVAALIATGLGVLGVVALTAADLILVVVVTVLGTGLVVGGVRAETRTWPAPKRAAVRALAAAGVVPVVRGAAALDGLGGLLLAVVASCAGIRALRFGTRRRLAQAVTAATHPPVDQIRLRRVLAQVPLDLVVAQWRRSEVHLRRGGGQHRHRELVTVRGLLLDEMERRDPAGFARWLQAAARARDLDPTPELFLRPYRATR